MASQVQVLSGKELRKEIRALARRMNVDLSKADQKKTEEYLKDFPSLSKRIIKTRNRLVKHDLA
ncbi:MAG: hypothetical protein WCA39_02590 [Nitrososphaeraceae archaeon]